MKVLPRVTHGFDRANNPYSHRNHQWNCFYRWHMDSTAQTALVDSEIINETAFTGDAWIRQRKKPLCPQKSSTKLLPRVTHGFDSANTPLWTQKSSTKTKSLPSQKSSTKLLPHVTHGFDSAKSSCGLRNHQRKLSHWRLRNHQQNCFHCWHINSTVHTNPARSKIITENWVTIDSKIINESASTGDAWIRQRKQPWDSEILNETTSTGDAWVRHHKEPLWPHKSWTKTESLSSQKSLTKLLPRVTHGFDSANSSCGLRNHQRNCCHGWRMDSTAQTPLWSQK